MSMLDNYMNVNQARNYLAINGVDWSTVWIRMQIGAGTIKSEKMLNARLIHKSELSKIISREKARKKSRMILK